MKLYICLLLFLNTCFNYAFKKHELPYSVVISKADLIVDGVILKVSKNEYQFMVSQFVKGKSNSKISISIWKEWICDPRIKELKSGQRLILFLKKTVYGNYSPINDSTGELYVEKDTFTNMWIARDFSNPKVLKEGIAMYLKTYTFYGDLDDRFLQNTYFISNKSIFEIYKMSEDNKFFKFLVDNNLLYSDVRYIPTIQFTN